MYVVQVFHIAADDLQVAVGGWGQGGSAGEVAQGVSLDPKKHRELY